MCGVSNDTSFGEKSSSTFNNRKVKRSTVISPTQIECHNDSKGVGGMSVKTMMLKEQKVHDSCC